MFEVGGLTPEALIKKTCIVNFFNHKEVFKSLYGDFLAQKVQYAERIDKEFGFFSFVK